MKKLVFLLVFTCLLYNCTKKDSKVQLQKELWNLEKREQFLENRNDSTTWDTEMLKNDKQFIGIADFGPFEFGAFPVSDYDLIGKESFKGLGSISEEFELGNKQILMNSFSVGNNELNKNRLKELKDAVFFHLIILTDTIDTVNYNLNQRTPVSRNHPDYLGQGFIKTKNNRIDYVAFQTAENAAYAIINTRLFDLNFGKTILIAPQKDKSLRSFQVKSPTISSDSIIDYTKKLLNKQKVVEFFGKKENI
ncbi:hypothetical protein [Polaribacter glomeratus]|uniref:Uncharacterized protein n=1 Tax=Polaribacter glomeratus TaxID=102 RepID=A0A2S7WH75_9FLAO|nr:hypothetical protein [Polaribacter glomeratus]PQJ76612.1 hypothetical protein BTO16_12015 [Polaribacter glomeratus]TXD67550.1 hypothetical protein ESX12_02905 [Polaribacter glomeratus]